jgi:uncharacterized protein
VSTEANGPDRPTTDLDTQSWWSALGGQTLAINACGACGQRSLYVRPFCPNCWSEDVALEPASGRATLYTWSVVHQNGGPFAEMVPYVAAIVELAEGPRMATIIEECPEADLRADLPLQVSFRERDGGLTIPVFRPSPH